MKTKLLIVLMAAALMLTISGTTQAIPLKQGPLLFKTYNWEIGTAYFGGVKGNTYFRNAGASYYRQDGTLISYNGANPKHKLFTGNANPADNLIIVKDPSLNDGEDTWALLEIRQLELGEVLGGGGIGDPIGPKTPEDVYWNIGQGDEWIRGVLWGNQDQAIEWIDDPVGGFDDEVNIYSTGGQFNIYAMDHAAYNPQANGSPTPADRDKTNPDEFAPAGWVPWIEDTGNNLLFQGSGSWFRFSGDLDDPQPPFTDPLPSGETSVYLDVDANAGKWGSLFQNWWNDPAPGERSDIWQTWNIGDPVDRKSVV